MHFIRAGIVRVSTSFVIAVLALWSQSLAEPLLEPAAVDFDRNIRPILENHCVDCHNGETQKSKLRLDDVKGILKGGDSGEPLFVRGSSADSLIIKRITSENPKEVMPADGDRLTTKQVELLRAWIDGGAQMPGAEKAAESLKLTTNHWSFQPIERPAVPMDGGQFARGAIDEFVFAKLQEKRLVPSLAADRPTLIRRLFLVAQGMPPTPQQVDDFERDPRPDAYERLVDAVLDSPHFGERWARHWMDVVRYADSNGFETNRERRTAYHYRDWIVESFNSDHPYDQFIREQIAGDNFNVDAATGFLVAGPYDIVKSPDINLTLMQRQDELADMVNTTGTAFLGMTLGCARCHNHKFDPVLQRDYYSLQAIFDGVTHGERALRVKISTDDANELEAVRKEESALQARFEEFRIRATSIAAAGNRVLRSAVQSRRNDESFAPVETVSVRFNITASSSGSEPCLDELEIYDESGKNVARDGIPSASGTLPGYEIHKLEHINDGKLGNSRSWISNTPGRGWVQIDWPAKVRIQRIVWGRDREGKFGDRIPTKYSIEAATVPGKWQVLASSDDRDPLNGNVDPGAFIGALPAADAAAARKIQSDLVAVQRRIEKLNKVKMGWVGTFAQPGRTHRLYRGEPMQKREVVAPDALSVLGTLGLTLDAPEQQRRVKLADWIASRNNPLTARVMVNRLWQYTFGTGIVDTPSDFGANGTRPTHPELLDWLADEFINSGWSIKHMLRLMLLSASFQQSSSPRVDAATADADGRLLWRYTPRRLEAESIRDSILAVSGALDLRMGGPGFYLMNVVEENVMHYFPKEEFSAAEFRRMVYQFRIRQTTDSVFSSFDCPDGGSVMPRRSRSNTPLQALNLFNSSFVLQQSEILANRLIVEAGDSPDAQVTLAFLLFYTRQPNPIERRAAIAFIREHGLQSFARAMFNTSEFLFIF